MLDLVIEYKQKRKELVKYRETLQRKPMETDGEWTQLKAEKNEHEIIGGMIRDLEYAIEWMETSRRPGAKRDIERRSVHQRTIYMEPSALERLRHNMSEDKQISQADHFRIDDALSMLTAREREVYVMVKAELLSLEQAAQYLGVGKSTVQKHLDRASAKVENQISTSLFSYAG
ncbi:sigma factor-like helix-turn-helix DNA-binding protein [Geomicrobium sediminis]|uniref:RNA polymerase sigma-70 factor (ECF subfamily) n=1 Tax=Geomicrobium sediminis TaxID=1347788 RepID=A0ABS2PG90_9BACL|nr:sigma factor-like helix-turn-helix DNA-binding protein [Geomicrobium sediminis]MBM7634060.1 RNA polymerase sigma-70 factor (ECF subfamily) [Geomicrobium sediminis]